MSKWVATTSNGPLMDLKTFFTYFGAKYRSGRSYPPPKYSLIIEPFAGAAGYSTRYHNRDIILSDIDPVITGIWEYLVGSNRDDILGLPLLGRWRSLNDYPDLDVRARNLISFWLWKGSPKAKHQEIGKWWGVKGIWSSRTRERIANQIRFIKHWRIMSVGYDLLPSSLEATWFIDPPYQSQKLKVYKKSTISYMHLARFCKSLKGQVIVCEQEGADWLDFRPHKSVQGAYNISNKRARYSREVIWTNNS